MNKFISSYDIVSTMYPESITDGFCSEKLIKICDYFDSLRVISKTESFSSDFHSDSGILEMSISIDSALMTDNDIKKSLNNLIEMSKYFNVVDSVIDYISVVDFCFVIKER